MVATSSRVQSRGYLRDCQLFWNAKISHIFNTAVFFFVKISLIAGGYPGLSNTACVSTVVHGDIIPPPTVKPPITQAWITQTPR